MNVTELARRLKIPTSELRKLLPLIGFDVGMKAIKVDDAVAQKIINTVRENPNVLNKVRDQEEAEEIVETEESTVAKKDIGIPASITVRDFATLLEKPVAAIIQELMKNGILANLNEQIDFETASIIAEDFGFTTTQEERDEDTEGMDQTTIEDLLKDNENKRQARPPVVVVMGHVDHGKTQLLDTIKKTNVLAKESGGITQHIGAYQVEKNGKKITFIDTPGHKAFTAMRSRGARVADIAILLIAADDGIKPQTEEVLQIIEGAKLPFIVAINKIDKPEADVEKVKQQLAQKNLLPEDWGGSTICVPISAKTEKGIDELLEHLLLVADVEKENIQANPDRPAICTVIESHVDTGEGPVTTAIVQTGTLRQGDSVQVGSSIGKIRALRDFNGEIIANAGPATPVKILGLENASEVGDYIQVIQDSRELKKKARDLQHQKKMYRDRRQVKTKNKKDESKDEDKSVDIFLQTDVRGSQEAIIQSLETLGSDEVKVTVVKKGLGDITEADVLQAESTGALIYGFNVKTNTHAKNIAQEKEVVIRTYQVIYDLFNDVKEQAKKLQTLKLETIELGRIKVLAVFRTEKKHMIIGGQITKGKIETGAKAKVLREDQIVGKGTLGKLQQSEQEVRTAPSGSECGIQFDGQAIIKEGDFIEVYKEEYQG